MCTCIYLYACYCLLPLANSNLEEKSAELCTNSSSFNKLIHCVFVCAQFSSPLLELPDSQGYARRSRFFLTKTHLVQS